MSMLLVDRYYLLSLISGSIVPVVTSLLEYSNSPMAKHRKGVGSSPEQT